MRSVGPAWHCTMMCPCVDCSGRLQCLFIPRRMCMFTPRLYLAFLIVLALCLAAGLTPLPAYHVKDDGRTITNSIGMKLVRIPAGKFLMGSPKDEEERRDAEEQHEVEITKPFYMGVYTVTQAEYQQIMGKNPSCFCDLGDDKD